MSRPGSLALLPRTKKGLVLFWTAILILSVAFQYAAAASPKSALAASANFCNSFSIQTSDANGGPVNQNHYGSKPEVYLQGGPDSGEDTLPAGTVVYYQVQEPNGDPLMPIRSTTLDANGTFRVQLAPFETTSNSGGEYKVVASTDPNLNDPGCTKSDNFKVDDAGSLKITKTVEGGPANFSGSFDFHIDCGAAGSFDKTIVFPVPGFVTISGIDAKAECTVSETDTPNAPAGYSWGDATFTGNPATIDSARTVNVGVVNHLNFIPAPALTVDKGVSRSAGGPFVASLTTRTGTTVYYRITITNTGNVPLSGVTLTDNTFDLVAKGCTDIPTTLAVGAHYDCNYSTAATTGTTTNIATGDSTQTGPDTGTATVVASTPPPPGTPGLTIDKTNDAPLVNVGGTNLPTAAEGSTVTFTLSYTHTGPDTDDGTITDVLPAGLTYVTGSATGSADFTFAGYNAGTRTLTWTASEGVSASGSVTYRATVDDGAADLAQPLRNLATIESAQTDQDNASSEVFVPSVVKGETSVPSAPPTDVVASSVAFGPGISLTLILLALAGLALVISLIAPAPARFRDRTRRQ